MVHKLKPIQPQGVIGAPPYYVFSKDAILGRVPSISSEVLAQTKTELECKRPENLDLCVFDVDVSESSEILFEGAFFLS